MTWTRFLAAAGILAVVVLLVLRFGAAREEAGRLAERATWLEAKARSERDVAEIRVRAERRVADAVRTYASELARLEPVIIRSTDTVTRYAATPDGARLCLPADRVRGIQADDAALAAFTPAPAARGAGELPDPVAPDRAGR